MGTFSLSAKNVDHKWVLIDAGDAPLGRLASAIAIRLTGKYKPTFTPHIDDGDYVVVINASKLIVTGDKPTKKKYYTHSGYPGGIKEATLTQIREKDPSKIIEHAVKGMLPKNKLLSQRMNRLKVFNESDHSHTPQMPTKIEVK